MRYVIFLIIFGVALDAKLEDHFKKITDKAGSHGMKGIDFIYMINLDQRPEKFEESAGQLAIWGIEPYRFSAVNGWELTVDAVIDIGVKYEEWMTLGDKLATYYSKENGKQAMHEYPREIGRSYFGHCMALGPLGCSLSHLSILQDAFDSGYETIWVMEDDIEILRSPYLLSGLIQELDEKVGEEGWDILFTDQDTKNNDGKYVPCLSHALRLNFAPYDPGRFWRRYDVTPEIRRVGARYGTYSMIVRRSGMVKLLEFFKEYNIFLPYDMDLVMPDDIRLFAVIRDIVSTRPNAPSDNGAPNYLNKKTPFE